jgi:hypothetical protein
MSWTARSSPMANTMHCAVSWTDSRQDIHRLYCPIHPASARDQHDRATPTFFSPVRHEILMLSISDAWKDEEVTKSREVG